MNIKIILYFKNQIIVYEKSKNIICCKSLNIFAMKNYLPNIYQYLPNICYV